MFCTIVQNFHENTGTSDTHHDIMSLHFSFFLSQFFQVHFDTVDIITTSFANEIIKEISISYKITLFV